MGRKPTPTALKVLAGNPGKRPLNHNEPKLQRGVGDPPDWLDERARAEWWRVVPDLEAAGVTTRVEATMLACYCQAVSRLLAAEALIAKEGITCMGQRGPMKHPAVVIAREQMHIIRSLGSEFGLSPASRTTVAANPLHQPNEFRDI
jgi:P27 family predicted phage terminase small subunit